MALDAPGSPSRVARGVSAVEITGRLAGRLINDSPDRNKGEDMANLNAEQTMAYVITGPTSGIGHKTALELAKRGTVVLAGSP